MHSKWPQKKLKSHSLYSEFTAVLLITFLTLNLFAQSQVYKCENLFTSNQHFHSDNADQKHSQLPTKSSEGESKNLPWFKKIDFKTVLQTLSTAQIVEIKDLKAALQEKGKLPFGTTPQISLITFSDGTQAVWKPGEKNRIEVSAFRLARLVGSKLIPPTVMRTLDQNSFGPHISQDVLKTFSGQIGSLQYYVETPFDLPSLSSESKSEIWKKVPKKQKAQRDLFNFVFGNWDLHWANILIDESYSIVQIDNGVIRSRQQVKLGDLPFIQRLRYLQKSNIKTQTEFPFDQAILLEKPSLIEFVRFVKDKAHPQELANYIMQRLKNLNAKNEKAMNSAIEFTDMIRAGVDSQKLADYLSQHPEIKYPDLTMKLVFWDNSIWIQAIGFQNYNPIIPPIFTEKLLAGYKKLDFQLLREMLPKNIFSDEVINEMLNRRDQIVAYGEKHLTSNEN